MLEQNWILPSKADSDLWYKDCGTHYEYIATYVDEMLVFSKDPMKIFECLKVAYPLQGVGLPEYYLGGDFKVQRRDKGDTISVGAKT